MNATLEKLYKGQDITTEETSAFFKDIFEGKVDPIVLSSFLTALKINGYTAEEIGGAASAMINAAKPFPRDRSIDVGEIVGTGGDCLHTINISTMAAIVCATLGLHVAKHGNTAVSSKSGASDVLTALGYNIRCDEKLTLMNLEQNGFAFFFAQVYHSGMRFAGPVRKALGTSTIFNILGPLTNPARVDYELLGCYDPNLLTTLARGMRISGVERGMVINGNGMDEISVFGETKVAEYGKDGEIREYVLTNKDFGITGSYTQEMLEGGDAEHNAQVARDVLSGKGTPAQRDVVCANASAMLHLAGKASSFKDGFEMAREALQGGKCIEKLEQVVAVSQGK
jgi:anthranilate phosphoribosyltransferase